MHNHLLLCNYFIHLLKLYLPSYFFFIYLLIGWMETSTFASWFKVSLKMVKERPLLLLYDGDLTHTSIPMIKAALEQDVILKFPPQVTDVLQPLDVACFGPLKRIWEARLQKRVK